MTLSLKIARLTNPKELRRWFDLGYNVKIRLYAAFFLVPSTSFAVVRVFTFELGILLLLGSMELKCGEGFGDMIVRRKIELQSDQYGKRHIVDCNFELDILKSD